ncbi:hypothetical protein G3I40_19315 [Streptomyces sp. SID14478]|uniref:hypothetical protein n=1 Tax=Streptomyces sp. SID14478 TaxID=2706073 RepID=UPI0013D9E47C|nr:hypothetical protein [Streptomyces sp. SID14478]NEB77353.1 hypothetical protein [Streptomyces sp. SID14478]
MEWYPNDAHTMVVAWHPAVVKTLLGYWDESAVLLHLALYAAGLREAEAPECANYGIALYLMPLSYLSEQERAEAMARLEARGFIERAPADPHSVAVPRSVLDVVPRRELDPQFLMQWNAAKASAPALS